MIFLLVNGLLVLLVLLRVLLGALFLWVMGTGLAAGLGLRFGLWARMARAMVRLGFRLGTRALIIVIWCNAASWLDGNDGVCLVRGSGANGLQCNVHAISIGAALNGLEIMRLARVADSQNGNWNELCSGRRTLGSGGGRRWSPFLGSLRTWGRVCRVGVSMLVVMRRWSLLGMSLRRWRWVTMSDCWLRSGIQRMLLVGQTERRFRSILVVLRATGARLSIIEDFQDGN